MSMRTMHRLIHGLRRTLASSLVVALLVGTMGGDLAFLWKPKIANAAYTGKQIRTVEYVLGNGSDTTARGDNERTYAGTSWNAAKSSAGKKTIVLAGSGIEVKNAFVDLSFMASNTVNVLNVGVTLDVEGSHASGTDAFVSEEAGASVFNSSGLTGYLRTTHDATSLFADQSDAAFSAGIDVVAGIQVDYSGTGFRTLTAAKLVITYELDYSAAAHDEVKTVRFPLDSTTIGDTGSRQTACAGSATCSFQYHARIPDAAADADILDVFFELQAEADTNASSSFRAGISGGSQGPSFDWQEGLADDVTVNAIFRPSIGGSDFARNATQTLDIANGSAALHLLGGELVVTYRFDTSEPVQTETVRYFLGQGTGAPGTSRNAFATTTLAIANSGRIVRNLWYRLHAAPVSGTDLAVYGTIVTSSERSQTYTFSATNPRAGDTPTIVFDMSQDAAVATSSSDLAGATQYSAAGGSPVAIEAFATFTWDGTSGGEETQTVLFSRGVQGSTNVANLWNNTPYRLHLPETVTKTRRSSYIETAVTHSDTAAVVAGTVTTGVNANTIAVDETADTTTEAYSFVLLYPIGTSTLASTTWENTIPWTSRTIEVNQNLDQTDERAFANTVVVTYDADYSETQPDPSPRSLRTVEYLLGNGSDNTTRGDNVLAYAGTSWNGTKGSAGTKNVVLEGRNIKIEHAYLDVAFVNETAANIQNIGVFLDVEQSSSAGTDTRVGGETSASPQVSSGLSGFARSIHDVTALFDRQTDAAWEAGISVAAGLQVDYSAGGARHLSTVKLVITYSQDFTTDAHEEVKTVRFPLDSTAGSDIGTRQNACAASATCSFSYRSEMPEDSNNNNIMDVFFELNAEADSGAASTLTPQISGGSAGPAFTWAETYADDTAVNVSWSPSIGGSNFLRNATQTLAITNGSVPLNVLGGEVVVTYRYQTDATTQTETVRFFLDQRTATTTTRADFATTTLAIANGGSRVRNLWYKMHLSPTEPVDITVFGKVGTTSTERSATYAYAGTNPRSGDTPFIILDLSQDAHLFSGTSTEVEGAVAFSVSGGGTPATEAFATFTWSGRERGPETRTVLFGAPQQGTTGNGNYWNNTPVPVILPESVDRTLRSGYVEGVVNHSGSGNIEVGRISVGAGGGWGSGTTTIEETADAGGNEAYTMTLFHAIATTTFSDSTPIGWTERVLEVNAARDVTDEILWSSAVVVTYEIDFPLLVPRYTQSDFRFYANDDTLVPYDPWPVGSSTNLAENAELTSADMPPLGNEAVRIRIAIAISSTTVASSSQSFKLQYSATTSSCGAVATSSWSDVGGIGSASAWRGTSTPVTDGTPLSTNPATAGDLLLSVSERAGTFEEENPSAENPWPYPEGEDVEFDWVVASNPGTVATNTRYCFRMVKDDATPLQTYTYYPAITTAGFAAESRNWQWYDDAENETPTSALAGENVAPVNVSLDNAIKLRVTVAEANNVPGLDQKFRLQFSDSSTFASGIGYVDATTTCQVGVSLWCYADGADADDDAITTRVLSDSTASGRHNEAPTTTSTFDPPAATAVEYEFTIRHAGAAVNTAYFFRVYDQTNGRVVLADAGETYPSLSTDGATLSVTVSGVDNGTSTEGVYTHGTSTATTIPFGTLAIGTSTNLAQRISVSTNASRGYAVYVTELQELLNDFGGELPDVTATNSAPQAWTTACPPAASGCFGYHAGDDTLEGSTRFLLSDTWAEVESTPREIMYNSGPTTGDTEDIVYRILARPAQEAGRYSTSIVYTVIPTF